MRGSVDYQINRIFMESGIFKPGTSRHKDKEEARAALADLSLTASSTNLASRTALHSYTYARDCKDTWHRLGHFAKQVLNLKDMTRLNGTHAEAYLLHRIKEGISYDCWKKEAAHLGKLENALLEWFGRQDSKPENSPGIRLAALDAELRTLARETLARGGKDFGHFLRSEDVIANMDNHGRSELAVVARIQLEGGARCREACRITREQLKGISLDALTGATGGEILLTDTKGGKPRSIRVSVGTYRQIEKAVESQGVLHVSMGSYASAVRLAARMAGELLSGTHAFRDCFARRRYKELCSFPPKGPGLTHEAAIQQVSWEMGHERADITLLYLR